MHPTITPNHPPCSLSRCMDPKGPRMERIVRVRWGVGSGTHNPLAGMPREAVDSASRIRPWNTPQRDRITRRNLVDRFPSPGGGSNLIGAHCARSRSMPAVGAGGSDQRQQGGNEHASLGEGKAELVVQGVRGFKSGIYPKIALSKGTKRSQIFKFLVLTIFRHFRC